MSSSSDSDDLVDTAEPHSLLFCEKNPQLQRVKRGSDSNSDNLHISADANQVV